MLKFGTVILAASALTAVFALPAHAKDGAAHATAAAAAASPAAIARAELAKPRVKRVRHSATQQVRRVAAVAAPVSHPQCFLFFCSAGGRHYNFLMLGIGF